MKEHSNLCQVSKKLELFDGLILHAYVFRLALPTSSTYFSTLAWSSLSPFSHISGASFYVCWLFSI